MNTKRNYQLFVEGRENETEIQFIAFYPDHPIQQWISPHNQQNEQEG
jgi:hypothetical protein